MHPREKQQLPLMAGEGKMQTIRFDPEVEEKGLRIIVPNGLVEYTEHKGVYRVPNYILELLDKNNIPYKIVDHNYARH
jgi:hypothetical protein